MWRKTLREYLLPGIAERDQGFREEIHRLSCLSLRVIGAIQIGVSLFMLAARYFLFSGSPAMLWHFGQGASIILLGMLNLALSKTPGAQRWARPAAGISGVLTAAILMWASLMSSSVEHTDDFILGQITLVMLVSVTTIPLRPLQTAALGIDVGALYVAEAIAMRRWYGVSGANENYVLFIAILTLLTTALTAVVYHQRLASYRAHCQTLEAAEELRRAETRILLSENAASLSRLAAALSHEMNNPLGALISGVDTLLLLTSRQATADAAEQGRLVRLQADIRRSIQQSVARLKDLVVRMQRFTNLDKAEVQAVDLNQLLRDVVGLLDPAMRKKTDLRIDLGSLPPIVCRPQQLSGVFSSLLANALVAVDGSGRVSLSTRTDDGNVEVTVEDNGRGVGPDELERIFDPGFRVAAGRVSSGNWSMFSARQIVREHGGEIRIGSDEGQGTRVTVTLPVADGMERPS